MAISTGAAILGSSAISAGLSGGGSKGSREARKARGAIRNATVRSNRLLEPYSQYGKNVLNEGFSIENDPGLRFALDEAQRAVRRQMGSQGYRGSGNILNELNDRSIGVANQYSTDALNRWLAQVGMGRDAAFQQAANESAEGNNIANIWMRGSLANQQHSQNQVQGINNAAQGGLSNYLLADALKNPSYSPSSYSPYWGNPWAGTNNPHG